MAEGRRIIKYMGYADIARIEKGDPIGGLVGTPLPVELEWSEANNFMLDLNDEKFADLPEEHVDALLSSDNRFKDVTGMQRIPANEFQRLFRAAPATEAVETAQESGTRSDAASDADEGKAANSGSVTGGPTGARGPTRSGGSTRGGV